MAALEHNMLSFKMPSRPIRDPIRLLDGVGDNCSHPVGTGERCFAMDPARYQLPPNSALVCPQRAEANTIADCRRAERSA